MRGLFKEKKALICLFLIYSAYLAFTLPSVHKPLVADDAAFAMDAENIRYGSLGTWHPPLYFEILRFLAHHPGIRQEDLRFFGIFCFFLNLCLIYLLSKEVSSDKKTGILAAFLFATHPWAIQGSLILDIDNTILTVLLTFFIFYFAKNSNLSSFRNYLFSGLLFFFCLWAKISTPLILLFSILLFYILKGEFRRGIAYTSAAAAIGIGVFFIFWAFYSRTYNLPFSVIFTRSLFVLGHGALGSSLPASSELVLRFLRACLWAGLYFILLWMVIFIARAKNYFTRKEPVGINDFLLLYTIIIFIAYILVGGISYGFAKYQYPLLPVLCVLAADFILKIRTRISKRQILLFICLGTIFIITERLYIGNLLYRVNYLLRKTSIFMPDTLKAFFIDFFWRLAAYFIFFGISVFLIRFFARRGGISKISIMFLAVLIVIGNLSYNFQHLSAGYFTTYCYGRNIGDYKRLAGIFKNILARKPGALIIGQDDILFNAGLKNYSEYNYSLFWNSRQGFLRAIGDERVACVAYNFSWNALLSYKEIFFHPEVKKALRDRYNPWSVGEYSVWIRK